MAFSRHFAINFSSASGFEADGGGGRPAGGQIEKLLHKPGLLEPKDRENKRGRELTERKKTRLLFTEEEQRAVYTPALFGCSRPLRFK